MLHPYQYSSDASSDRSASDIDDFSGSDSDTSSVDMSKNETKPKETKPKESKSKDKKHKNPYSKVTEPELMYRQTQTPSRHVSVQDSACISVSKKFASDYKKTSADGSYEEFKYLLKKSPIPVLLHYFHYLFYINRGNVEKTQLLVVLNKKYNVVSRYFLKALSNDSRTESAMKSYSEVSKIISDKVKLNDIKDILNFTPEFIAMTTIQSGDLKSYDKIVSEWELSPGFKRSCDLVAAFFGIKSFFSDESRYENRQNLVISCICGGSVNTLSKIVRVTDSTWLSGYTMRKTREICIPPSEMMEYLRDKYGLMI